MPTPMNSNTLPASGPMPAPQQGPNCWQCRYFRITHLPATPYACAFMGFQSKALPCIEVLRADGSPCMGFAPKATAPASRSA